MCRKQGRGAPEPTVEAVATTHSPCLVLCLLLLVYFSRIGFVVQLEHQGEYGGIALMLDAYPQKPSYLSLLCRLPLSY